MNPSVKFAISIPEREFRELEKIRKKEGLTRSRLVLEAITFWKSSREKEKLVRMYEEGYRRHPEKGSECSDWEKVSLEVFSEANW
jgi:metal-responsive CopG/Arc/MetJ family transcriptional regulator